MFAFRLWLLVTADADQHVRWCAACDQLYWGKNRKQKYCTHAVCQKQRKQQSWKRYQNTPSGKQTRLRLLKKRYAKNKWKLGARKGSQVSRLLRGA